MEPGNCSTPNPFCQGNAATLQCKRCHLRKVCSRCQEINRACDSAIQVSSSSTDVSGNNCVCFFCRVSESAPFELEFKGQDKLGVQGTYHMKFFNSNNKGGLVLDVYFNTSDGTELCITKGQWAITVLIITQHRSNATPQPTSPLQLYVGLAGEGGIDHRAAKGRYYESVCSKAV